MAHASVYHVGLADGERATHVYEVIGYGEGLDMAEVRRHILAVPHVRGVHDLRASQIATGLPVLSAHVVLDDSCFQDGHTPQMLAQLQACVAEHFEVSVEHSTFQFEPETHSTVEHAVHD